MWVNEKTTLVLKNIKTLNKWRIDMDYYTHKVPGRLRVKIPSVKGDKVSANHAEELVKQLKGVSSTSVSTTTGSVVVNYCPKIIDSNIILSTLENEGFFDSSKVVSQDQHIHKSASKAGQLLGKFLFGAVVEKTIENAGLILVRAIVG